MNYPVKSQFRINPLSLVGGTGLKLNVSAPGSIVKGTAGRNQLKDVKANINVGSLPITDKRLQGVQGQVNAKLDHLKISESCKQAKGEIKTNILAVNQAQWQWEGPVLSGPISCEDGRLLINLKGANEVLDVIAAKIYLSVDRQYEADILMDVQAGAPANSAIVAAFLGFQEVPQGYRLYQKGTF